MSIKLTDKEKLQHIEDCGSSGLTTKQYCVLHGLHNQSLSHWQDNLKEHGVVTLPSGLKPAVKSPDTKGIEDIKEQLEELRALKLLLSLGYTVIPK